MPKSCKPKSSTPQETVAEKLDRHASCDNRAQAMAMMKCFKTIEPKIGKTGRTRPSGTKKCKLVSVPSDDDDDKKKMNNNNENDYKNFKTDKEFIKTFGSNNVASQIDNASQEIMAVQKKHGKRIKRLETIHLNMVQKLEVIEAELAEKKQKEERDRSYLESLNITFNELRQARARKTVLSDMQQALNSMRQTQRPAMCMIVTKKGSDQSDHDSSNSSDSSDSSVDSDDFE